MEIHDIVAMFEKMAENGHAPPEGCSLFSVGYEDAFRRLRDKYLIERFSRGGSGEKFVIGPFGSGKTHFLRQLLEIAQDLGCVTSEVPLNTDLDFTQSLLVYREIVRDLRVPNGTEHGIQGLLLAAVERVRRMAPDPSTAEPLVQAWVAGLDKADFKLDTFGRVSKRTLQAYLAGDEMAFTAGCRWLSGEVSDRALSRDLSVTPISRREENLHGRRALLSLFQFVRHAKFQGTIVGLDEAEQGLSVDRKKMQCILSMLQSGINAIVDLERGAALVVYAVTPDIVEKMEDFPALQQRVADPFVGRGFFDGETLAPKIDLARREGEDPVQELRAIGRKLVEVLYAHANNTISIPQKDVVAKVSAVAEDVASTDIRSGNRRTMVKRTCAMLLRLYNEGVLIDPGTTESSERADSEV